MIFLIQIFNILRDFFYILHNFIEDELLMINKFDYIEENENENQNENTS